MKLGLAVLALCLLTGCCCPDQSSQQDQKNHYVGTVLSLHNSGSNGIICYELAFKKADDTMVTFNLYGTPPVWQGFHGEILLNFDGNCGYRMVSARELK